MASSSSANAAATRSLAPSPSTAAAWASRDAPGSSRPEAEQNDRRHSAGAECEHAGCLLCAWIDPLRLDLAQQLLPRPRPEHGALAAIDAKYVLYAVGITPTPEAKASVSGHVERVIRSIEPWAARHMYLNFAETSRDASTLWSELAYHRLRRIKADFDPDNVIRSNHPVSAGH